MTAQDVVWSFNHFMDVSPNKTTFGQVADVTAPDDHTVQFTLKDVYAPFEAQIGAPVFWILPREVVEQDGDATRRVVGEWAVHLRQVRLPACRSPATRTRRTTVRVSRTSTALST